MKSLLIFTVIAAYFVDHSFGSKQLGSILAPVVDHVVNPLTQGIGTGAQNLGPPAQAAVGFIGDGANTLVHGVGLTLNDILGGAGTGVYNTAPAASSAVDSLDSAPLGHVLNGIL